MEAGPALDAVVAEVVMGWTQHRHMLDCWCIDGVLGFRQKHYFCPSTDIAAAMQVLEHVVGSGFYQIDNGWRPGPDGERIGGHHCRIATAGPEGPIDAIGETIPLAIARCALAWARSGE